MRDLERFGVPLGVVFQIKDDILGVRAAEDEIGKSNTSDIAEGKVTLLIHHALKNASPGERERLLKIYGHPPVSEEEHRTVEGIFEASGAFAAAERQAEECLAEAMNAIPLLTEDAGQLELLRQLSAMMLLRKV